MASHDPLREPSAESPKWLLALTFSRFCTPGGARCANSGEIAFRREHLRFCS
jgi:hypothetical protein